MERGEGAQWREVRVFGGERRGCLVERGEGVWWREERVFGGER